MAGHLSAHILNNATSQADRRNGAPAPGRVGVDERSLAQLLAFAANYGGLIRFYDLENLPSGDWAEFFASDPAIADALHASLNLAEVEQMVQAMLDDAREAIDHPGRLKPLMRLLKVLLRLLAILDRAHIGWSSIEAAILRFLPDRRRDGLGKSLKRLQSHFAGHTLETGLQSDFDERDGKWHGTLIEILEDLAGTLIDELQAGIVEAEAAMMESLATDGHQPQNAVYNAFVQLFVQARAELNRFPQRLVDFYYGDVLQQHALAATPDRTFLTFTRAKGVDQASVPRGALFPAGTDSQGAAINYAALTSLEVTPAVVAEVSVHRVTHAELGLGSAKYRLPSGVLAGMVKLDPANPAAATPFPMFGGADSVPTGALTMQRASLGFCIASPVLMLTGGSRTVEIGLVVSYKIAPASGGHHPHDAKAAVESIAKALESSLELHYSTAGGWMLVEKFHVTPSLLLGSDRDATLYTIAFHLPPDAPPLVAVTEKPAADAPAPTLPAAAFPDQPQQPAVVANMNLDGPGQQTPAFALLSLIEFDHIYLDVFVEGLEQLTLTTPNGPADTSQNFPVFGLPPAQYSALDIYAPELFVKPVKDLSVAITWAGLPVTSTGFKGYYQNYTLNADGLPSKQPLFDNSSFRIAFSVDNPGYWDVARGPQPYLFQTGPDTTGCTPPPSSGIYADSVAPACAAPVRRTSWLDVPGIGSATAPPYYNPTASALRLSLAAPEYAFGNVLYSSNLMAASMAQTQAALEKACKDRTGGSDAQAKVSTLAQTNATVPDKEYAQSVGSAVKGAVSSLTGEAVAAVQQGVAQSKAAPETKAWWLTDLENAISSASGSKGSLWDRLVSRGGVAADIAAVVDKIKAWIAEHEHALGEEASAEIGRAQGLLSAAGNVAATHSATLDQPPAVQRPAIAAAAQQAQIVVLPSPLPNPPWLPMASSLTVNYTASVDSPLTVLGADNLLGPSGSTTIIPVSGSGANPLAIDFWHIGPFGVLNTPAPEPSGGVSVLPPIEGEAALYIQLSVPVTQISLLFVLTAGPNGWWDDPPEMIWEERVDGRWQSCTVLDDTTQGLKSSGIVTLAPYVPPNAVKAPRLRVRAHGKTENAPTVQCVVANALTVQWDGPGGAATLGIPMAAGTISKSQDKLPGLASIAQPMESFGGSPPAVGGAFQMWMAERLRHKGFGIDAWDYERLVLAAVPSLWQAAVVPAVDESDGKRVPGKVWIVAVAGPHTPNVTDKTIPQVDLTTLSEIGDTLNGCISTFAEVVVTNPPYLRLTVDAQIEFSANDTPAFWEEQLNAELVEWLSPWPPSAALGPRPDDYFTRRAIAEFIRGRSYVLGISELEVSPEAHKSGHGYYYLTSALHHSIASIAPGKLKLPSANELFPADGSA